MSIVSVSTIKEYLPELAGSTGADTDLTALRDRVETAVARYLGFPAPDGSLNPVLDVSTYTVFVDSPAMYDSFTLQLPIAPIATITSVHADINRKYESDSLIDASVYSFNAQLGRIYIDPNQATTQFKTGYRTNKVIVTAGYTSVTLPDDLEHAICVWCSQLHRNKANQGKEQISQANSTVRISVKTIPDEVKELLNPIRLPRVVL